MVGITHGGVLGSIVYDTLTVNTQYQTMIAIQFQEQLHVNCITPGMAESDCQQLVQFTHSAESTVISAHEIIYSTKNLRLVKQLMVLYSIFYVQPNLWSFLQAAKSRMEQNKTE